MGVYALMHVKSEDNRGANSLPAGEPRVLNRLGGKRPHLLSSLAGLLAAFES